MLRFPLKGWEAGANKLWQNDSRSQIVSYAPIILESCVQRPIVLPYLTIRRLQIAFESLARTFICVLGAYCMEPWDQEVKVHMLTTKSPTKTHVSTYVHCMWCMCLHMSQGLCSAIVWHMTLSRLLICWMRMPCHQTEDMAADRSQISRQKLCQ